MASPDNLTPVKGEGEKERLVDEEINAEQPADLLNKMNSIAIKISKGATTFLIAEYMFLSIFLALFAVVVCLCAEPLPGVFYTTIAFLIGGITSIFCGFIGMRAAVYTNVRATKECATSIESGFKVAFRGG